MADASNLQTNFLGGEISPYAQGRADEKEYRIGMSTCLNGYPIEAGAWTRRQGFRFAAYTRYGQPAWLLPFAFAENKPYNMEFTNQFLRLFNGADLVMTNDPQTVVSVSGADPAAVTTAGPHGWSTGNMVQFYFADGQSYPLANPLMNRQFLMTSTGANTFTLTDPITGLGLDGSTVTYATNTAQVVRVQEIVSPYIQSQLTSISRIQAEGVVLTLLSTLPPWALVQLTDPTAAQFATFNYAKTVFSDGPYMDPNLTGSLTPSGTTGSITLSGAPSGTFVSTDVNRLVRLFSEPSNWASGTAYTTGNTVKFTDGNYYIALANSTGKNPDTNPTLWGVTATAAIWTWAQITVVGSDTSITATIKGADLLYAVPIHTFRLGLYSDTTGYPTNGAYHEGRIWLSGAQGNRIDSSVVNPTSLAAGVATLNFAPTQPDGTVTDANAIAYVFNAEDVNEIFNMLPADNGIICLTQGGEWMIAASQLSDPLTPTSIQAHRRSKYKAANVAPVHAGFSVLFVQAQQRKLMEYVADVFSGRFLGRNLSERARHLTVENIAQIAYQQEISPTVWARMGDGSLKGLTYKRETSYTSEPPTINGWHRHQLGSGRLVESITVGPSVDGNLETLAAVTNDPTTGLRHVELMVNMFDETDDLFDAWFLDDAVTPIAAIENTANTQITFYGMYHLVGKSVTAWVAGIDAGDYTVAADGSIVVPINAAGSLLTDAWLNSTAALGRDFGGLGVYINRSVTVQYAIPSGTSIQSYISAATPEQYIDDYLNNRVYSFDTGGGSSSSAAVFNRFTGALIVEKTAPQLFNTADTFGFDFAANPILDTNGFLYTSVFTNNSSPIAKIKAETLEFVQAFGASDSQASNDNKHALVIGDGVYMSSGSYNMIAYICEAFPYLNCINTDIMEWAGHSYTYASGYTPVGITKGETINNVHNKANSYTACYHAAIKSDGTGFKLHKTTLSGADVFGYANPPTTTGGVAANTNSGIVTATIGSTILPASIDAAWTVINSASGPLYDPLDGHLICMFFNLTAPNSRYVTKFNARTGAIIWNTLLDWRGVSSFNLGKCKFIGGILAFLVTTDATDVTAQYINTADGSLGTPKLLAGVGQNASVSSICVANDGTILSLGDWGGSTTGVTGVNGTVSFSNRVFKLQGLAGFPGNVTENRSAVAPAVIGFTYTSQGAMLRGIAPDATGARNGPALGKTRRDHRFACLLPNTQGISFGTDFTKMIPASFVTPGGNPIPKTTLWQGVYANTLQDRYSYDGMLSWQITRPYPATVAAAENFLQTQDR